MERSLDIAARILSDSQEEREIYVLSDAKGQRCGRNYRFIKRRGAELWSATQNGRRNLARYSR
jgi:hypothetical protein